MRAVKVQSKAIGLSHPIKHEVVSVYEPYLRLLQKIDPNYLSLKRVLDVLFTLALTPILLPLCGLIALAIKLESPGPAIFKQVRVGRFGKSFLMYKFRSMRIDAEANGPKFADVKDPRITRLGRILRKYRLDELPQFLNILRGEMSLIGPRPEQLHFAEKFQAELSDYQLRHLVQPGITGWAQVHQGYCASLCDTRKKLRYDLFYIKNISFRLDFIILVRTVRTILTGFGHR